MKLPALVAASAVLWSSEALSFEGNASRPNLIWIMADDFGWGEVGLYPANSPHGRIATPNLDSFGNEGIVFKQAYAGYTVCAPSRTTLMTGRHSGSFVKYGLTGTNIDVNEKVQLLPALLQAAGYKTGAFGKTAPLSAPQKQGFDHFVGQVDQGLCHNMYPKQIDSGLKTLNFELSGNYQEKNRELCMKSPESYNYTIDVFHESAMMWLQKVAKGPDPFFMYLSFTIPHAGGWGDAPQNPEQGAPVPTDGQYADKSWPDVEKDHAAVVTYLDGKVGDVLENLKRLNIDETTLVFFGSDNGAHLEGGHDHRFFDSTGGLPGHKRSMYEGGMRSPTMARWPAGIKAGRTSNFSWAFWDVLPTFAELAGVKAPDDIDGISIVPELKGEQQQEHEYLYFTWQGDGGREEQSPVQGSPGYTIRKGNMKGMVPHCKDGKTFKPGLEDEMRLFDLDADPFETQDLASAKADVVRALKELVVSKNLTCKCYQCGEIGLPTGEQDIVV